MVASNGGCPPGQSRRGGFGPCIPHLPSSSMFRHLPGKSGIPPSGGLYPFSNASRAAVPSSPTPAQPSFSFLFSGVLDASASQTENLNFPFSEFSIPVTVEIDYTLSPLDFRTNNPSFFGVVFSSPEKNFGFEIQLSSPSTLYVSTYSQYQVQGDDFLVMRTDYLAVWPPGTPVVRVAFGEDMVPHVYFDGVEVEVTQSDVPYESVIAGGNRAQVNSFSSAVGQTVTVNSLKIAGGFIAPPAPVSEGQ